MKLFFGILLIAVLVAGLGFLYMVHAVGANFTENLRRRKPGEGYNPDIDVSFYTNGPLSKVADRGLEYMKTLSSEELYLQSEDGLKLHATLFHTKEPSRRFVIGMHGFQSKSRYEFAPHIQYYQEKGYQMLLPDDRAHGESEGAFVTMGIKDRRDCVLWAKELVRRFGPDITILLHGISMGGATVLNASGEADLPKQVAGVISDCGFTSVKDSYANQIESIYHIPPALPVKICGWFAKHKMGFDFSEARPIDQVKKAAVPILFVQGEADQMVPKHMAEELYAACAAPKKLLLVPKANHAESIAVDPDGYHKAMEELFSGTI